MHYNCKYAFTETGFFYFFDSLSKLIIATLPRVSFVLSHLIKHSKLELIIFIHKFGLMGIQDAHTAWIMFCFANLVIFSFSKRVKV